MEEERKVCAVSPSLLASFPSIPKTWNHLSNWFGTTLGAWSMGVRWQYRRRWTFLQVSQAIEQQVQETSTNAVELFLDTCPRKIEDEPIEAHAVSMPKMGNRWGSPKSDEKIADILYDEMGFLKQLRNREIGAYLCGLNGHLIVSAIS